VSYLLIMWMVWGTQHSARSDILPNKDWCERAGKTYAGQVTNNPNIHVGYFCVKIGE
jgi:hypothetical protein